MPEPIYAADGGANDAWVVEQNRWARGWRRVVFPGVFLVYLVAVASGIAQYSHGPVEIIGFLALGAFCVVYIGAVAHTWDGPARPFWTFFAVGVGLVRRRPADRSGQRLHHVRLPGRSAGGAPPR